MAITNVELGDEVVIYFSHHPPLRGVLAKSPTLSNESPDIRVFVKEGELVYIRDYNYMVVINER